MIQGHYYCLNSNRVKKLFFFKFIQKNDIKLTYRN